ncbi:MAG: phytanoyl-CoA dioxygenase family protein [Opitutaceae bacterium]
MTPSIETTLQTFHADGYALVPGVLDAVEVATLRATADRFIDHPEAIDPSFIQQVYGTTVLRNTQSLDPVFCELLGRKAFVDLAAALLGPDFGFCGQNVIRSGKGEAISIWHVDDELEVPLPDNVPSHNRAMHLPVIWFSFQIALSDILTPDDGATEVVPGSHYSGRVPPRNRIDPDENDLPSFEGRRAEPILCRAGDVYLFNHQLWHRGRPNRTGKIRYLMQNQYCRSWVLRRFGSGPHRDCHLPAEAADRLSAETRRFSG